MIKPSECRPPDAKPDNYDRDMTALEKMCDQCIRSADSRQDWPALCGVAVFPRRVVDDTIAKYRDAGWSAELRGYESTAMGMMCIAIDRIRCSHLATTTAEHRRMEYSKDPCTLCGHYYLDEPAR